MEGSIDLSLASLREYGRRYRHWVTTYSGGKDSSVVTTFVAWAIKEKLVPTPESFTVLYADTRMELPPLHSAAMNLLGQLQADGFRCHVVLPTLDDRYFVYMLGRGVPPPKNRFRWCTSQLKIEPMVAEMERVRSALVQPVPYVGYALGGDQWGYYLRPQERILTLTGVRLGESAARDQRIAVSCSKDSGECGQGWFQVAPPEHITDTLAPILHWRLCHVFDWCYFESDRYGYDVSPIAVVYGEDEIRTGCAGCNLASRDVALERLVKTAAWAHLSPLLELKPLYQELTKAKWRLRKSEAEIRKDGQYSKNAQRLGPLTMEARAYGLEKVLDIQRRANVDLINPQEEARIRELWTLNTWPNGWSGNEVTGDIALDAIRVVGNDLVTQALLVR